MVSSSSTIKKQTQKPEKKTRNGADLEGNRPMLINVNVMGSCGPIRFFVRQNQPVSSAIQTALITYARQGRRPVLSSHADHFLLYCSTADGWHPMEPTDAIGTLGCRNFMLCKNSSVADCAAITRHHSRTFKNWFHKSFHIFSH